MYICHPSGGCRQYSSHIWVNHIWMEPVSIVDLNQNTESEWLDSIFEDQGKEVGAASYGMTPPHQRNPGFFCPQGSDGKLASEKRYFA